MAELGLEALALVLVVLEIFELGFVILAIIVMGLVVLEIEELLALQDCANIYEAVILFPLSYPKAIN